MKAKEREEKLQKLCSDKEFLAKLTEAARLTGWSNDYCEIEAFIVECHISGGVPIPDDMRPYDNEYE